MTRVTRGRECAERQGWGCEIVDLAEPKENKEQSRLMRRRVMVLWPLMDLAVIFFSLIILESICNFDPGLKYPAFLSCTLLCCLPFIQQPFSSSFLWEAFLGRSVGRWQLPSQSSPPVSTVTLLYTNKMHLTLACGGCKSFRIYLCINLIFLFPCLDVLYVSVTVIKQWLSLFFFFSVTEHFVQTHSHIEPNLFGKQHEPGIFEVTVGRRGSGAWPTSFTPAPTLNRPWGASRNRVLKKTLLKKENLVSYWVLEMFIF